MSPPQPIGRHVTVLVLMIATLGACSVGGPQAADPTTTAPVFSVPSSPGAPQPAPTSSPSTTGSTTTTQSSGFVPAPPTITGPTVAVRSIQSPSGNIGCLVSNGRARCDIAASSYPPPLEPDGCEGVWGASIEVGSGAPATFQCVTDTVLSPDATVLAYGSASVVDGVACLSSEEGMRCWVVAAPHHGFRIARASYEVY